MHRVDGQNVAVALPTPEAVGPVVGYFAAKGVNPATQVTGDWLNAVQEEIAGPVLAAGLTLSKTSRDQLLKAIRLLAEKERTIPLGSGGSVYVVSGSGVDITQTGNITKILRSSSSDCAVQIAWPLPLNIRSGIKLTGVRLVMWQQADFTGTATVAAYLYRVNADGTTTSLGSVDIVALNPTLGEWVVVSEDDFGLSDTEFTTGQGLYLQVNLSLIGGGAGELRFSLIGLTYGF